MTPKAKAIILAHAVVGWALCGATMGVGLTVTSLSTALVVNLVAVPVFFIGVSWVNFLWFSFTGPRQPFALFGAVGEVLQKAVRGFVGGTNNPTYR